MNSSSLAQRIKSANREIYNNMSPQKYNQNESIFNDKRKSACSEILKKSTEQSGKEKYLDIATGTGNLLRLGEIYFDCCYGVDLGDNMLSAIRNDFPKTYLASADAEYLPFKDDSFNCVSCYAMLHHLLTHEQLFKECYRVLKEGGTLYTDHDPNYFFNRFYHFYYKLIHRKRPGFGSDTEELAEYHNTYTSGINPEKIKSLLLQLGFNKVKIVYRITEREKWSITEKIVISLMRLGKKILPLKTLNTHFAIIARK